MRILIVKVSSLGDIIHTLPAVTDAYRASNDVEFDWVVEENFVEVPSWHPAIGNVIPVAIRRWRKNIMKTYLNKEVKAFRKNLQGVHYDMVIDAQGLIKSGIISRMSKGLTVGLSNTTIREPLATLFYNKRYSVPWNEHAVDRVRQLFSRALKYSYDNDKVDYGIDISRIDPDYKAEPAKRVMFLHGTTWGTKHWPKIYWRQLAQIASGKGYEVEIPWGDAEEKARAEYIAEGIDGVTVLDKQDLSGLARKLNRCSGVISVDTGLGHLAAALAKPTISLYGPTDPGLSGTRGEKQLHLNSDLKCAPCVKKTCTYTGPTIRDEYANESFTVSPPCFSTHRPETVWSKFEQLLAG